jgi:hypothetical protein
VGSEAFTKWDGGTVVTFRDYEYFDFAMEYSPKAVISNPLLANAEKGREIYGRFGQHLVDAVEEMSVANALPDLSRQRSEREDLPGPFIAALLRSGRLPDAVEPPPAS